MLENILSNCDKMKSQYSKTKILSYSINLLMIVFLLISLISFSVGESSYTEHSMRSPSSRENHWPYVNITHPANEARFQRKVMYDAIPVEYIAPFKRLCARLGQSLLEQLDTWLAEHDIEDNPDIEGTGRTRLGLGIYLLEEILEDGETDAGQNKTEQGKK